MRRSFPCFRLGLAFALAAPTAASAQDIAVLGAAIDPASNVLIRDMLMSTGDFDSITLFDVAAATPTIADLSVYHAALVWSEVPFSDPVGLG
ncbi:MAG: hypothetical protein H0V89_07205, partial [Deltaproteobacteria bacterium]|nr:hypothetical protein [Deltaproteobacteria bacterium]